MQALRTPTPDDGEPVLCPACLGTFPAWRLRHCKVHGQLECLACAHQHAGRVGG